jgi:NDP-sugar pyrophosphorylase family protein
MPPRDEVGSIDAAILAGGLGSRLAGCLEGRPKALADIAGQPFLAYLLRWMTDCGLRRFVFCLGHGAEQIREYVRTAPGLAGAEVVFSQEETALGTGGCLRLALPHFRSEPVLVANGDTLAAAPLAEMLAFHRRCAAQVTLAAAQVDDAASYGALELAPEGRVTAFREKEQVSGAAVVNAGLYLVSRNVLQTIAPGFVSLEREVLPRLLQAGRVYAFQGSFPFLDVGVPERFRMAQSVIPQWFGSVPAGG